MRIMWHVMIYKYSTDILSIRNTSPKNSANDSIFSSTVLRLRDVRESDKEEETKCIQKLSTMAYMNGVVIY